jgi:hypothetical protein
MGGSTGVGVFVFVMLVSFVRVVIVEVDIEFDALDLGFLRAGDVQMIAVEAKFCEFVFELGGIHAEIKQRADKHIAADAAENIQIQ